MIAIVDYGLGNLFSVAKALEMLGAPVKITSNPVDLKEADKIILPGVGAFGDGMLNLKARGLSEVLKEEVVNNHKPFFGICLGLQLLADQGFEFGEHVGLGFIPGQVTKLEVEGQGLKVPHVGWNDLELTGDSPLFKGLKPGADFYFLHSYQLHCADPKMVVATTNYGETITAAIQFKNIFATQFHPEKSQDNGLKILENFLSWQP